MSSTSLALLSNIQWLVFGVLLLLTGQLCLMERAWGSLASLTLAVTGLLIASISLPIILCFLCVHIWLHENTKPLLLWLVLVGTMVVAFAFFVPHWLPVFLVTVSVSGLFVKTWLWVNQSFAVVALLQILLLVIMGGLLVHAEGGVIFLLALVSFSLALFLHSQARRPPAQYDEQPWLDAIELSRYQERQRIYRNIHDEVGADLLQLIYQLDEHEAQAKAKTVMQKIRQSVAETSQYSMTFEDLFQDLCSEAQVRLASAAIDFKQHGLIEDAAILPAQVPVTLARLVRESISNIIKHAKANKVYMEACWQGHKKTLLIKDDGVGIQPNDKAGKGLKSIQQRAEKINANVSWNRSDQGGTEILVVLQNHDS